MSPTTLTLLYYISVNLADFRIICSAHLCITTLDMFSDVASHFTYSFRNVKKGYRIAYILKTYALEITALLI